MIIGFFGKGGSGKTTTCFRFLQSTHEQYANVLAIDADHNMDLSFNLGIHESASYVGQSISDLEAFLNTASVFTLHPPDSFTEKYTERALLGASAVRVMISGPHTESIFQHELCSHSLFTPVMRYVQHLSHPKNELVVIDNTAGMDAVGVGIPSCLQAAVICVESTTHSMKVARRLIEELRRFPIPVIIAANKIQTQEQEDAVRGAFSDLPLVRIPLDNTPPDAKQPLSQETKTAFQTLHTTIMNLVS